MCLSSIASGFKGYVPPINQSRIRPSRWRLTWPCGVIGWWACRWGWSWATFCSFRGVPRASHRSLLLFPWRQAKDSQWLWCQICQSRHQWSCSWVTCGSDSGGFWGRASQVGWPVCVGGDFGPAGQLGCSTSKSPQRSTCGRWAVVFLQNGCVAQFSFGRCQALAGKRFCLFEWSFAVSESLIDRWQNCMAGWEVQGILQTYWKWPWNPDMAPVVYMSGW